MVPSMKPNTVSFLGGREFFGFGVLGFFVFPLRTMNLVLHMDWNMALEPDYSVLVFLLDSVAELSVLRLWMCLYFVMAENS